MKRYPTLLVAAVMASLGSMSHAQDTSIYGLIDLSVGRTQAPGGASSNGVDSGRMTTSFIGIKGGEDLGGGLTANFAIESFMRNDSGDAGRFNGDPMWSRSAWVGVAGSMGSLSIGRNTTSLFVQTLIFNAFGDSFGFSPSIRHHFISGTVSGDTGWSDSIKYASPRFGGLSFTVHGAAGENNGGTNTGLSALYFGGPIGAGLAWQKVKKGAAVDDTTTWQLAGSYDFGALKAFAQIGKVDNDTSGNGYDLLSLGLTAPIGPGKLLAQWGRLSPDTGSKRNTFSLGYDHFVSKRTDLYAAFMSDKVSGQGSGNNFGVGVRHRF